MPNMSYCRFQNTVNDMKDCLDNLSNKLSEEENEARKDLLTLCIYILNEAQNITSCDDIGLGDCDTVMINEAIQNNAAEEE